MKRLIEAGLFGEGLVAVDTPELINRYNNCLKELGIEPTGLKEFHIDGIGWSHEIAMEKNNLMYLCAGIANPMGVILSPQQRNKPIYFPFSSYERPALRAFFDRHHNSISDITATTFLGIDIDQELTQYQHPYDLTLVEYIVLRSVTGGLVEAANRQKELIKRFESDGLGWFDQTLLNQIIESGKQWGDLRHRRIDIPDFRFDMGSLYTRAFGGVFVLRHPKNKKPILVLEDTSQLKGESGFCERYMVNDIALPEKLRREKLAEINPYWYRKHPQSIEDKKEEILADVVCGAYPNTSFTALTRTQKRRFSANFSLELTQTYHQLERFGRQLANGTMPHINEITPELRTMLLRPHHELPPDEQNVLWLLLCKLQPYDIFRLYTFDKNSFFAQYKNWPEAKKEWAVTFIHERYVPHMNQ